MKVSKKFLEFKKYLRTKNLSVNERVIIEFLFEYHNIRYGYSYIPFKDLMTELNTTSKNRVSETIKKLVAKEIIVVEKESKNNRYFIIGVDNFISIENEILDNEEDNLKIKLICSQCYFSKQEAIELLIIANNNVQKVMEYYFYTLRQKNVKSVFHYTKSCLENKINTSSNSKQADSLKFANFTQRDYDYEALEKQLLGWEKEGGE